MSLRTLLRRLDDEALELLVGVYTAAGLPMPDRYRALLLALNRRADGDGTPLRLLCGGALEPMLDELDDELGELREELEDELEDELEELEDDE